MTKDEQIALLRKALESCKGYMTNIVIDLQTSTPKKTTLDTLRGGIKNIDSALNATKEQDALKGSSDPQDIEGYEGQ